MQKLKERTTSVNYSESQKEIDIWERMGLLNMRILGGSTLASMLMLCIAVFVIGGQLDEFEGSLTNATRSMEAVIRKTPKAVYSAPSCDEVFVKKAVYDKSSLALKRLKPNAYDASRMQSLEVDYNGISTTANLMVAARK